MSEMLPVRIYWLVVMEPQREILAIFPDHLEDKAREYAASQEGSVVRPGAIQGLLSWSAHG